MLVFIDESGDPGRKILNNSSTHFVIGLVMFGDNDDALECDKRIDSLRGDLGLSPGYEFHFSSNSKKVREAFLNAVSPFPFFYHVFALNKDPEKLIGPGFNVKESLYKFATRLAFENVRPYLTDARVIIDRSGDKRFREELSTYLRRRIRDENDRSLIRKLKLQDSKKNNLLQLADYVVGVSNRVICGKPDGVEYRRKYLAVHEISLRVWPN